jgi:hypothetical protein
VLQNNQNLVKSNFSKGTHFFEETSGLGSILSESEVEGVFKENGSLFGGLFWNSLSVFWVYLYQKIHGVSCSGAVTVFISSLVKMGRQFPSSCTSNFCTNRAKLAMKAIQNLLELVYEKLHQKVSPENRWHGHDVFYVDGATVSLDDTPANQAPFPQSSSQKEGLGFPLIRAVFVFPC